MKRTYELSHDDLVVAAHEWLVSRGHEKTTKAKNVKLVINVVNGPFGKCIGSVSVEVTDP